MKQRIEHSRPQKRVKRAPGAHQGGFTLVELIAVMALLVMAISMAAPSLAGFFRGRALDAEARRFLSLTRLGQSRAASEGAPMILWVDVPQRAYGLEEDSSYTDQDVKAVEYKLDRDLSLETSDADKLRVEITRSAIADKPASTSRHGALPRIRFEPDGGIDGSSLETVQLKDRDGKSLRIELSRSRLNYEIPNQNGSRVAAGF